MSATTTCIRQASRRLRQRAWLGTAGIASTLFGRTAKIDHTGARTGPLRFNYHKDNRYKTCRLRPQVRQGSHAFQGFGFQIVRPYTHNLPRERESSTRTTCTMRRDSRHVLSTPAGHFPFSLHDKLNANRGIYGKVLMTIQAHHHQPWRRVEYNQPSDPPARCALGRFFASMRFGDIQDAI